MTIHHLQTPSLSRHPGPPPRAYVAFGAWLRTGFVALSVAAIALIMLAEGEASAWAAGPSAIAAILLAIFAWRRAWILIQRLEPADSAEAQAAARSQPGFGGSIESAAAR